MGQAQALSIMSDAFDNFPTFFSHFSFNKWLLALRSLSLRYWNCHRYRNNPSIKGRLIELYSFLLLSFHNTDWIAAHSESLPLDEKEKKELTNEWMQSKTRRSAVINRNYQLSDLWLTLLVHHTHLTLFFALPPSSCLRWIFYWRFHMYFMISFVDSFAVFAGMLDEACKNLIMILLFMKHQNVKHFMYWC